MIRSMRALFLVWLLFIVAFGDVRKASAADAISLSQAVIHNSPADIASWPADYAISSLTTNPNDGIRMQSAALTSWPDFTPPGWDGPIQYTVWMCANIEREWHCAGFIQMWRGRMSEAGHPLPGILSDWNTNYAYDAGRWGPMANYVPHAGDVMAFFLSAGNARGVNGVTSVRSRTNVVQIRLPQNDTGSFDFSTATPTEPQPAPPVPAPTPVIPPPAPLPSTSIAVDYTGLLQQILASQAQLLDAQRDLLAVSRDTNAKVTNLDSNVGAVIKSISTFVGKYILPAVGAWVAAKKL